MCDVTTVVHEPRKLFEHLNLLGIEIEAGPLRLIQIKMGWSVLWVQRVQLFDQWCNVRFVHEGTIVSLVGAAWVCQEAIQTETVFQPPVFAPLAPVFVPLAPVIAPVAPVLPPSRCEKDLSRKLLLMMVIQGFHGKPFQVWVP